MYYAGTFPLIIKLSWKGKSLPTGTEELGKGYSVLLLHVIFSVRTVHAALPVENPRRGGEMEYRALIRKVAWTIVQLNCQHLMVAIYFIKRSIPLDDAAMAP